ncbi:hypothetical protein AXG93_4773s1360 [Marchantia polymorpha subsp. ruderalis]|uniref:Transmembrane protein adipocyte-associated 1 n=1 Tax=Marchantia polymorpha subsp. ruderalis TaxID=1480154 RepID=A0A176WKK5_MARPO|nr:hypothetical protein AXG93_4773s1360 [Marchantia polymorpha subsp. ruderalis]
MGKCLGLVSLESVWADIILLLPALLFLIFLISRVQSSVRKLVHSKSHIMGTYYSFLWIIAILNLCWCVLQIRQAKPHQQATAWNVMSLVTRFGMVLLEVSVVVFLSQGYLISGWDALLRTLLFSGVFAALDAIVKAVYIFGLGIPLLVNEDDGGDWRKWGFWLVHTLLFIGVYLLILILPYTKWRDHLPARPSFYRYVFILFVLNSITGLGSFLLGLGADFGHCIYAFTSFAYYAFYPPLLYMTFLADFFREEDLQMEDVYYSEMKDAGYFDADWE